MKRHLIYILTGIIMILIFILVFIINDFKVIKIEGHSMNPTLYEGNYVISSNYVKLERGSIIMFYHEEQRFIKRVIGLPGDKIELTQDCDLYVNDKLINEDYIYCNSIAFKNEQYYPLIVPSGEYFVLGDNRNDSLDSRVISVGTIKEDKIIGEINLIIYPFKILK